MPAAPTASPTASPIAAPSPTLAHTLPNGLRVLACPMPQRATLGLSVYIRSGSLQESRSQAGLSHVVEHMAFKGTQSRSCQQINLAAEALGADLNAHTDKDHTAYHVDGLAEDLPAFVDLLADLVCHPVFPEEELQRERQVILHELDEVEEDPSALVFQAFDRACYGEAHAAGRPVIGLRRNIERFSRQDLLAYLQRHHRSGNVVVAAAGPLSPDELLRHVEAAFADLPAGASPAPVRPDWQGGLRQKRLAGSGQCQLVWGWPLPALDDPAHGAAVLTAAVLGDGMSSPLLDELRERQALAYHLACSADIWTWGGQFVIEASTRPAQAATCFDSAQRLLEDLASHGPRPEDLARARKQLRVRALRAQEQPGRRMETAAMDLFGLGRLRDPDQTLAALEALSGADVQACVAQLLSQPRAMGLAGSVPSRWVSQLRQRA